MLMVELHRRGDGFVDPCREDSRVPDFQRGCGECDRIRQRGVPIAGLYSVGSLSSTRCLGFRTRHPAGNLWIEGHEGRSHSTEEGEALDSKRSIVPGARQGVFEYLALPEDEEVEADRNPCNKAPARSTGEALAPVSFLSSTMTSHDFIRTVPRASYMLMLPS